VVLRGGVQESAPKHLRALNTGFYRIGCPNSGIECMIAQVGKLLTCYGCHSRIGIQLSVTMELFLIELGLSAQPLQESYEKYGKCIIHSWIKSVWEKVCRYKIKVEIGPLDIDPPRKEDRWFMQAVDKLSWINCVRLHQQVLFMSDVLEANGKTIDKRYMEPCPPDDKWSCLIFPNEKPPQQDFALWCEALCSWPQGVGSNTKYGTYCMRT
jgi:hypothetical protein